MIYLDSAATSFQKPRAVRSAVMQAMRSMSSPGRGSYAAARRAEDLLYRTRALAAETFGVSEPERVIFTTSATHGLNIAIKSIVPVGGRVVISGYEHNAVTRPLHALRAEVSAAASPLFDREACVREFSKELRRGADAAVCTTVSNVFGAILPVKEIAVLCGRLRIPLIIDASQSAGILPLDANALGAAFVAMPGHKGLYGPQGTGLLLCGAEPASLIEGGTGSASLLQDMPDHLPDRLEAGTHNVPGIAGLEAGLRFVRQITMEQILRHERRLIHRAADGLRRLSGVTVYAAQNAEDQAGVLSFLVDGREPEEVAEQLAARGIALRAGYHCAPTAHCSAGTLAHGTVRLSVSSFNTEAEIDFFLRAMRGVLEK